jgi:hypothetical protein
MIGVRKMIVVVALAAFAVGLPVSDVPSMEATTSDQAVMEMNQPIASQPEAMPATSSSSSGMSEAPVQSGLSADGVSGVMASGDDEDKEPSVALQESMLKSGYEKQDNSEESRMNEGFSDGSTPSEDDAAAADMEMSVGRMNEPAESNGDAVPTMEAPEVPADQVMPSLETPPVLSAAEMGASVENDAEDAMNADTKGKGQVLVMPVTSAKSVVMPAEPRPDPSAYDTMNALGAGHIAPAPPPKASTHEHHLTGSVMSEGDSEMDVIGVGKPLLAASETDGDAMGDLSQAHRSTNAAKSQEGGFMDAAAPEAEAQVQMNTVSEGLNMMSTVTKM